MVPAWPADVEVRSHGTCGMHSAVSYICVYSYGCCVYRIPQPGQSDNLQVRCSGSCMAFTAPSRHKICNL